MKRVIIGSFAISLLAGAAWLGTQAVSNLRVKCEDGGHPECAFTESIAHEVGKNQGLGATGCALVGGGVLLFLRSKAKGDVTR